MGIVLNVDVGLYDGFYTWVMNFYPNIIKMI